MLLGILPVIALGFLAAFVISLFNVLDISDEGVRAFYGCYAAGAVGAIVSVLSRMGSKKDNFTIDHETPRWGLYALGSYRPIVGGLFGIAMYFLVSTRLLQIEQGTKSFAFYVTVAFLSGFSERWTRVILSGAQSVIGGAGEKPEVTQADVPADLDRAPESSRRVGAATGSSDGGGVVVVVVAAEPDILLPPADVVERVAAFAPALDQVVAPKELDRNLIVGSWNLRAFGGLTKKWRSADGDSPGVTWPTCWRSPRCCRGSTWWRCRRSGATCARYGTCSRRSAPTGVSRSPTRRRGRRATTRGWRSCSTRAG